MSPTTPEADGARASRRTPDTVFDTHAHLDDAQFDADRSGVIARAREAGVRRILSVGDTLASSERALALAREYAGVRAAVGVHPHAADTCDEAAVSRLRELAAAAEVAAIGEIGLDYFKDYQPRRGQRAAFERQAALAAALDLPVVVHNREATDDCLAVLGAYAGRLRGVAHCFSGDAAAARRFLDLGFYISLAGNVTYRGAEALRKAARFVPEEHLLVETDCPHLVPRGAPRRRNEPAFILHTLRFLAALRGVSPEHLARRACENAERLFGGKAV